MSIKKIFPQLSIAVLFCLVLQSCGPSKPGFYKTDDMGFMQKRTLHGLNNELLIALKNDVKDAQEKLMSQEYIDDRVNRMKVTAEATQRMHWGDYELHNEYLVIHAADTGSTIIKERGLGINNFNLQVPVRTKEMYIAQFNTKSPESWMITATYSKLEYGWKIDALEISPYAENGKTAPELFAQAKELLNKGSYLDANNAMACASNCMQPSAYMNYVNQKDIMDFVSVAGEAISSHAPLPIVLNQVASTPKIWRVTIERNKEGAFPNINYISKTNLLDTMALKKENLEVQKVMPNVMAGIEKDKKYIYYTIYNESAKGVPITDHYDLRQKL